MPRTLPQETMCPISSPRRIGLMLSTVPISAVALEMRPPRFKYARSSTVKNWHMCGLLERRYALISSKLFPSSIMRAASSTCNPSPREAA